MKTSLKRLANNAMSHTKPQNMTDIVELSAKTKPEPKKTKLQKLRELKNEFILGLDKATIKRLESLPIDDFLVESNRLISKSLNISPDLYPGMQYAVVNKKMDMAFDFTTNIINVNPEVLKNKKSAVFAMLRHEMQHYKQNLAIIRTEKLGAEAIENYAKILTKAQVDNFIIQFKNMPETEIIKLKEAGQIQENSFQAIVRVKKAAQQGDTAIEQLTKELFDNDLPINIESWKRVRNKAIESNGLIKDGSKEAVEAKMNYDGFFRTNGMSGGKEYFTSKHEVEAYTVQSFSFYEYLLRKFF